MVAAKEGHAASADVITEPKSVLFEVLIRVLSANTKQTKIVLANGAKILCRRIPGKELRIDLCLVKPGIGSMLEIDDGCVGVDSEVLSCRKSGLTAKAAEIIVPSNREASLYRISI